MSYQRDGDTVTITMTTEQYWMLLVAIGYATASAPHDELKVGMIRLMNEVNRGNPEFTPYQVPED